ncbi:MAG: hypothetical protein ACRDHZ_02725 [Ktedonobacteraceae bacterium]
MPRLTVNLMPGFVLLVLAGCCSPAQQPMKLVLKPYAGTDLRTIDVTVGGETSPFLFDTGAGFTLLTPEQVKNASCTPFGQDTGFRADGSKLTLQRCGPVSLDIGGFKVDGEVGVFDLMALLGKSAPPMGGLVGLASFDDRAITLDLAHDQVVVETRQSLAQRVHDMRPVHIRIVRGAGGDVVPFIEVQVNIGTLWLEVDSGNNGPVFLAPHAQQQLGITIPKGSKQALNLNVIGLGKVPVTVASRDMIYDGQLDPAFLKRIMLTIDFTHRKAWAKIIQGDKAP